LAERDGARAVGEVPFDPEVVSTLMDGRILIEACEGPAAEAVRALWETLVPLLA
jgi:hypothetical protein